MQTIQIEIKNPGAMNFLFDLQNIGMIEIKNNNKRKKSAKLSEKFYGCINTEQNDKMQTEILKMRDEWDRNI